MNIISSPSDTTSVSPDIEFYGFCDSYHAFLNACACIEDALKQKNYSQGKVHLIVAQYFIEAINQILSCKPDGTYDDQYREKNSVRLHSQRTKKTPHRPVPFTHIEFAIIQLAKFEHQLKQKKTPLSIIVFGKIAQDGIDNKYNLAESKPFRKIPGLYPICRLLNIVNGNFENNTGQIDIIFLRKIGDQCMRILRNIFVPYLDGGKLKSEDPEIQRLYSAAQIIITTYESNTLKFPIESIQTLPISLFGDSGSQGDNGKKAEKNIKSGENTLENSGNREVQSMPKFNTFLSCTQSLGIQIKKADVTRDTPSRSRELPYQIIYIRHPHTQTWCICDQVNYSVRVYDGIIDIATLANECSSSTVSSTDHAREIINWNGSDEHIRANITRVLKDGISHNEALRNHDIKTLEGARNILEESALILAKIGMMYLGDEKWDLSTMLCGLKSIENRIGFGKSLRYFPNAGLNRERGVGYPKTGTLHHVGHIREMLVSIGYQSGDIIMPQKKTRAKNPISKK